MRISGASWREEQGDDRMLVPYLSVQSVLVENRPRLITIRGSAAESIVKITTVSGLLVNEIRSEGGTAVWDGRDVRGEKVRSGIYLALIADDNGDNACIGKFSVIAR